MDAECFMPLGRYLLKIENMNKSERELHKERNGFITVFCYKNIFESSLHMHVADNVRVQANVKKEKYDDIFTGFM